MFLKLSIRFCFVYFLKSKWRRVETETCIYIYTCITYRKLRKGLCIQNFGHFFLAVERKSDGPVNLDQEEVIAP